MCPFNKAREQAKFQLQKINMHEFTKKIIKNIPPCLLPLKYKFNNEKYLSKVNSKVLVIAARDDKTVPVILTHKLTQKLKTKKTFYTQNLKLEGTK